VGEKMLMSHTGLKASTGRMKWVAVANALMA
jgi:hypothetical protein